MITVAGKLIFGFELDGVAQIDFVMRQATISDAISAIEKSGDTAGNLRLRIFKAAEQIESLGTIKKEEITGDLLMTLPEEDIEPIFSKQDEIEKKLKGSKSAKSNTQK